MAVQQLQPAPITFDKADLQRLTGRCGWTADRAALSEDQLDSLVTLAKSPRPSEQSADFKFWLNEIVAQYVGARLKRAQMLKTLSHLNISARWMYENPHIRRPKLTTLADHEMRGVKKAHLEANRVLERLSAKAEDEIRISIWRNRFVGPARADRAQSFRQLWQLADDHFLCLQAACERIDPRESQLSEDVRDELQLVVGVFERLRVEMGDLTSITQDALAHAFRCSVLNGAEETRGSLLVEDPVLQACVWLGRLQVALQCTRIRVGRGRDEAPERALVAALAQLYRVTTGKEPGRIYSPIETRKDRVAGEAGDFLELARTLVGYAAAELPADVACGTRSLSRIVRIELERRKTERPG